MTSSFWTRFAAPRISRRRGLRLAAAVAATAWIAPLAACDDDDGDPAGETPRSAGTLRYGTTLPFSYGFDPHLEQGSGLGVIARMYGYPFHVDPRDDSLVLDHAQSVEQPEPGVYVIRLGERRFHASAPANGRAVNGDDIVFSMRRYRDHPLITSKFWHTKLLGEHGALDQTTVIMRMTRPYAYSLHEMGSINAGAILPREAIDAGGDLRAGTAGSGPMQLGAGATVTDARLERFDGYEPQALLDAMEFRVFESEDAKSAAFHDRSIDVMTARDRREALQLAAEGVEVVSEPSLAWTSLGWRVDRAPFNDERVRRAVDIVIDRDALVSELAGGDGDVAGPVNPHLANGYWALPRDEIIAAHEARIPLESRIDEARKLLDAAGARDAEVEMQVAETPELLDLAALVREQVRAAGIRLKVMPVALAGWFFNFQSGAFHATLISHAPYESPDAALRMYHTRGIEGAGNPFGYSAGAVDWLIERSWSEDDREQRQATVLEVQRLMIESRPMVHLFSGSAYVAAHTYVRDSGLALPGSLARYHYAQWLDVHGDERPD